MLMPKLSIVNAKKPEETEKKELLTRSLTAEISLIKLPRLRPAARNNNLIVEHKPKSTYTHF